LKIAAKVCVMPPPKASLVFEFGFPKSATWLANTAHVALTAFSVSLSGG
jgi:hypothetical protein